MLKKIVVGSFFMFVGSGFSQPLKFPDAMITLKSDFSRSQRLVDKILANTTLECREDYCPSNMGLLKVVNGDSSFSCQVTAVGGRLLLTAGHCLRDAEGAAMTSERCKRDVGAKFLNGKTFKCTDVNYVSLKKGLSGFSEDIALFSVDQDTDYYQLNQDKSYQSKSYKLWSLYNDAEVKNSYHYYFLRSDCVRQVKSNWGMTHFGGGLASYSRCRSMQGTSGAAIFDDRQRVYSTISAGMGPGMTPAELLIWTQKLEKQDRSTLSIVEAFNNDLIKGGFSFTNDAYCIDLANVTSAWRSSCVEGVSPNDVAIQRRDRYNYFLNYVAELKQKIIKIMYGIYDKKTAETSVSYHLEIVDLQEGPHKGYSKLIASPLCFDNEVAQKLGKEKFEKIRNQSHIEQEYVVGPGLVARKDFALQLAVNENRILSKTKGVNLPMCVE